MCIRDRLESIAAALGVSVNALKDYGVETAGDLMSLLVRLEDSFEMCIRDSMEQNTGLGLHTIFSGDHQDGPI